MICKNSFTCFRSEEMEARPEEQKHARSSLSIPLWQRIATWLHQVADSYQLKPETTALILQLLSKATSYSIPREKIQLRGCSCLYIASVVHGEISPRLTDLVEMSCSAFTKEELKLDVQEVMIYLRGHACLTTATQLFSQADVRERDFSLLSLVLAPLYSSMTAEALRDLIREALLVEKHSLFDHLRSYFHYLDHKKFLEDRYPEALSLIDERGTLLEKKEASTTVVETWSFERKEDSLFENFIESGVAGKVYRKNSYAVKVQKFSHRAVRELAALTLLRHENVIRLHSFSFTLSGKLELELELGVALSEIIHAHERPLFAWYEVYKEGRRIADLIPERREYLQQITCSVAYLHSVGVLHRDIKSANVVVVDGVCKLIDFGTCVTSAFGKGEHTLGATTECYCCPESLFLKNGKYGTEYDIWSLGVLALELETRFIPFFRYAPDWEPEIRHRVIMSTMCDILGTPPEKYKEIDGYIKNESPMLTRVADSDLLPFLQGALQWDPDLRLPAEKLLELVPR